MISAVKFAGAQFVKVGILTFLAAVALIYAPKIGWLEGHLYPVVADFHVVSRTATTDNRIAIDVEFYKVRDCKFIEQDWSIQVAGGYWVEFAIDTPEDKGLPPRSKAIGAWGGHWILNAPPSFSALPMKVVLYHQCWGPLFWTTETYETDLANPQH